MPENITHAMQFLEQHHPQAAQQIAYALNKACWHPAHPRVVNFGLYNAGKSSLENMLIDDVTDSVFATADIPKTVQLQYHVHWGIELVDTPGLDREYCDDVTTFEALRHCDVILLVHSLDTGELDALTIDYLTRLQEQDPESLSARMIAVWTFSGTQGLDNDRRLGSRLTEQLQAITGGHPPQVCVDSSIYRQGLREGNPRMMAMSGIPALRQRIADQLPVGKMLFQVREGRRLHQLGQGLEALQVVIREMGLENMQERSELRRWASAPLQGLANSRKGLLALMDA